ncbi:MAG TPA: hypothetical protein VFV94_17280 [Polyangiaceae bacterium]|nr:hypothetical protein [Polyangiaceae bacterium]
MSLPGLALLEPAEKNIARDSNASTDAACARDATFRDGGVGCFAIYAHEVGDLFNG